MDRILLANLGFLILILILVLVLHFWLGHLLRRLRRWRLDIGGMRERAVVLSRGIAVDTRALLLLHRLAERLRRGQRQCVTVVRLGRDQSGSLTLLHCL